MNYFITGTDTDVGKTVVTYVLGLLLQEQGHNVGVMKPVQCAGEDAEFLVNALNIKDAFHNVNPFYADEPLSPQLAFHRAKKTISIPQILKSYQLLSKCHDMML
ncbi:MAG: dethiobiotin synthase, partial [Candidatus Omnitrophica bacterium]|nr:dethiobiotin synthase [Candidatus Omnitrophota bacterium]